MRYILPVIIIAITVAALALSTSPPVDGQQTAQAMLKSARPYVALHGPKSAIATREYHRILDESAWSELWKRHAGSVEAAHGAVHSIAPVIDFENCMVIAIFSGDAWNCDGHYVLSIDDMQGAVRLRFDSHTYQTSGPDGGGVRVRPFGIFIVPRTTAEYIIEEEVQGLIGGPEKWKEQKRFAAIDDN